MPAVSRIPLIFPSLYGPPQDWELQSNEAAAATTTAQSLWAGPPPCFSRSPKQPASSRGPAGRQGPGSPAEGRAQPSGAGPRKLPRL